jgi:hypothetical protein
MKAVTLISAIIFIAITISIVAIIYQSGIPLIEKMQQSAALDRITETFSEIDSLVRKVAQEGNGSRRVFDIRVSMGRLMVDTAKDMILWKLSTENMIIPPRSADFFGNLIVGSNLNSTAYEDNYSSTPAFVLENEHLRVFVRKIGSPENPQIYNTTELILGIYQRDLDTWLPLHSVEITIDDDPLSMNGTGYTYLERSGDFLPFGRVNAYMDSPWGEYYINLTLGTGTDFLEIDTQV